MKISKAITFANTFRDFVTIEDVLRFVEHLILESKIKTGIYNLSSYKNKTILEIAQEIQNICFDFNNKRVEINLLSTENILVNSHEINNSKVVNTDFDFLYDFSKEIIGILKYCKK